MLRGLASASGINLLKLPHFLVDDIHVLQILQVAVGKVLINGVCLPFQIQTILSELRCDLLLLRGVPLRGLLLQRLLLLCGMLPLKAAGILLIRLLAHQLGGRLVRLRVPGLLLRKLLVGYLAKSRDNHLVEINQSLGRVLAGQILHVVVAGWDVFAVSGGFLLVLQDNSV